jgi:glycerol-3-phosphate dehydrogenase (NAD(P)+)
MTATEDQSRNRQVGLRLGCGDKIGQIIDALGSTAEGVSTAPLVQQLAKRSGIETPITDLVAKLIEGTIAPADLANALMTRPIKSEFD